MSLAILGEGFDLHCGGLDLKFPHHENERAQAVALGKRFANHWMHHAFVVDAEGEKMSKSLGNFDNLLDLIDTNDPRAFRMALLQAHYRSPVQITRETIDVGREGGRPARRPRPPGDGAELSRMPSPTPRCSRPFRAAMDDDLDTPRAMAIVFDDGHARPTPRSTPTTWPLRRPSSPRSWPWPTRSASSCAGRRRTCPPTSRPRSPALDAARAGEGLRHRRRPAGRAQAAGWVVETHQAGHHRPPDDDDAMTS